MQTYDARYKMFTMFDIVVRFAVLVLIAVWLESALNVPLGPTGSGGTAPK